MPDDAARVRSTEDELPETLASRRARTPRVAYREWVRRGRQVAPTRARGRG
jgi:hypothetical protein